MKRGFLAMLAVALVASCSSSPRHQPDPDSNYRPITARTLGENPYPVGVIPDAVLHDADRNRDVVMSIDYPTRGGPFPVIVFSPAWGLTNESYTALSEYWTGHGYISIVPAHADAGAMQPILAKRREDRRAAMEKQRGEKKSRKEQQAEAQGRRPPEAAAETLWSGLSTADWAARVRDVTFVVDSLDALEQKYPELAGKMRKDRIGVAGHSFGALTAMLAAGTTDFRSNPPLHLGDPRVKALLALSPQGLSQELGLTAESWKELRVPSMFITGSLDRAPGTSGDAAWRRDPYAYSPAGDKFFISFAGARTGTFTGALADIDDLEFPTRGMRGNTPTDIYGNPIVGAQDPRQTAVRGESFFNRDRRIFAQVKTITTAFFDAYLKGDASGLNYVKPGGTLDMLKSEDVIVERK